MSLLLTTLILLTLGYLASRLAEMRGRDPTIWFFLGMVGGLIAITILYLLPSLAPDKKSQSLETEEQPVDRFSEIKSGEWFYLMDTSEQKGPMNFEDLFLAWDDGRISGETYLWTEGMVDWVKAKEIPMVMGAFEEEQKKE